MRPLWLAIASAAFAVVAEAPSARAAVSAVTVNTVAVQRQNADGSLYECPGRGAGSAEASTAGCIVDTTYQGIGFRDCSDDTVLVIPVTVTGLPDATVTFEIWAGTADCTQAGATNNASTGTCWPVAPSQPAQAVMSVRIRAQDIVGQLGVIPPAQSYSSSTSSVCTSAQSASTVVVTDDAGVSSTTAGESTVNIYFMFFPNGSATPSISSTAYPVKVKLSGPGACSSVTAGSGDGLLILDWIPPAGDTTIIGYNLYAAPAGTGPVSDGATITVCPDADPGTELFDDAGIPILDDAGNPIFVDDAGNPVNTDAGCYSQYVPPTTNACGTTGGTIDTSTALTTQINGTTNASGKLTGLTNGVDYDVAVAAFDQFGNAGQISNVVCSTPKPINDFWKIYNQDGGSGFCAVEVIGSRGSPVFIAGTGIIAIVLLRRRRKK